MICWTEVAIVPELVSGAQQLGVFTKKEGEPSFDGNSKYFQGELVGNNPTEMESRLILDDDIFEAVYRACRAALDAQQQVIRDKQGIVGG